MPSYAPTISYSFITPPAYVTVATYITTYVCLLNFRVGASDSSLVNGSTIIIAGSVGGAAVFFIILLCIVILCVRQSQKKRSHALDNKMMIEIDSDIKMSTNPSYSITKQSSKQEDQYDYVLHGKVVALQDDPQVTIKMDTDPSYGRVQGCDAYNVTEPEYDAAIQSNASYSSDSKETIKMSEDEDQDGYVETNPQSTERESYHKAIGLPLKKRNQSMIMTLIILAMLRSILTLPMIQCQEGLNWRIIHPTVKYGSYT